MDTQSNAEFDFFAQNNPNAGLKAPGRIVAFVNTNPDAGPDSFMLPTIDKNVIVE